MLKLCRMKHCSTSHVSKLGISQVYSPWNRLHSFDDVHNLKLLKAVYIAHGCAWNFQFQKWMPPCSVHQLSNRYWYSTVPYYYCIVNLIVKSISGLGCGNISGIALNLPDLARHHLWNSCRVMSRCAQTQLVSTVPNDISLSAAGWILDVCHRQPAMGLFCSFVQYCIYSGSLTAPPVVFSYSIECKWTWWASQQWMQCKSQLELRSVMGADLGLTYSI